MKKYKKRILVLFIMMILIFICNQSYGMGDIIDGASDFISQGKVQANNKIDSEDLKDMSNTLYNVLLVIGIVVAIIVGLVLGIKFIMGSIEEKAEIKTMLIPYIIGCVIVFGAFTIWRITVNVLQRTELSTTQTEGGRWTESGGAIQEDVIN